MSASDAEALFGQMLDGALPDSEIADILVTLADRGETADDIVGAARAMRARMLPIAAPQSAIDVCGTGGDNSHSLNVSTAVAIVVAACGVPVAKHGNRAATSRAGAADTLEALGLDLDVAAARAADTLADLGLCFLFAPRHHPALARIAPIRRSLGRRTIFNLLGPLANPAGVRRQLIGVPHPAIVPLYRDALNAIGVERAMIVSGHEGLDELSVSGPSTVATIGLALPSPTIAPEDFGLARHPADALRGGDAAYNAAAIRGLVAGARNAYRDAVLLNAGAALVMAGEVATIADGIEEAGEALDKGLASALLDCWIAYR